MTVADSASYGERDKTENYSDVLNAAIKAQCGDDFSELDAPDFDATAYINKRFPCELSLQGVDAFTAQLRDQLNECDQEILHVVRGQAEGSDRAQKNLADAKSAIQDLVSRISRIQEEAAQSEALVTELCRDIQSLDTAKRNLTATITALKRLVMLVMALEQLKFQNTFLQKFWIDRMMHDTSFESFQV